MKKILLILILIIVWQLSQAQERFYIIPGTLAKDWKQYKITHWWGIDPVQLKTGEWVVSEQCYYLMTTKFIESKKFSQDVKLRADSVRVEIEKYPARIVRVDEFKVLEQQIEEKTIPK